MNSVCTAPNIEGLTATVVPLDAHPPGEVACWRDLRPYPRPVELTFRQVGVAKVVVTGGRLGTPGGLISVTRLVLVAP